MQTTIDTGSKKYLLRSFNVEVIRDPEQKNPHSLQDAETITHRLKECADIFGMRILDHVIIGNGTDRFYSFSKSGLL